MRVKLITQEIRRNTPPLYTHENTPAEDVPIAAKFFTPWSSWTWYMTEADFAQDLAFGYAINAAAPDCAELGYFSLAELRDLKGPFGLTVERDRHYGKHTLAEVMAREPTAC